MNPQIESQINGKKERFVESAEDLIFYTNTDESAYPIFIDAHRRVWTKTKPFEILKDEDGFAQKRRLNIPIIATFYVKKVEEISENISHPMLEKAVNVMKEVTGKEVIVKRLAIIYEVHAGDIDKLLGEVKAYAIKVYSDETPYSGAKRESKRAWAVGYEWKKRIAARAPELEKYAYVVGSEGSKGRAYVRVVVKLPVPTQEFVNLFNLAFAATATATATPTADLEKRVAELERLIEQKKAELKALEEQLQSLRAKLQLEKLKTSLLS